MTDARVEHFRELFGVTGEWALLNHGGYGRVPRPVLEAQAAHRRWVDEAPIRFFVAERRERHRAVREAVAARVGARADNVALVPNATFGLNVLAFSAAAHGATSAGTSLDYDGVLAMWGQLAARGHRHQSVTVDPASPTPLEDVSAGLRERPGLLMVPHVVSPTATYFDLSAHRPEAGVLAVDGAHVPGHLDLDLASLGVDAYVGDLHKWACAPRGTAFLWVRPELHDWLRLPVGTVSTVEETPDLGARLDWLGTMDPSAWLSIPEALDLSAAELAPAIPGQAPLIAVAEDEMTRRGWEALPTTPALMLRAFVAPPAAVAPDAPTFIDRLRAELLRARVDAPVIPLEDGRVALRLSLSWYVTPEDVSRLLGIIDELAPSSSPR